MTTPAPPPPPLASYRCPADGARAAMESPAWCCPTCGGPWDLGFAPASPVPLKSLPSRVNSLWRYAEALPLAGPSLSLGEGRTPLVPLTGSISAKLDFLMPTLSFKDRGAVMLVELARRLGPSRVSRVLADSSGNAGTAIAAYCARAQLPCTVYVPEATSPKKTEQIRAHGAQVTLVPGDREAAAAAARAAADEPGTFYASHVHNPFFLHGTKTYVYELWEDLGGRLPDSVVVPVGNGTLLLGAALAIGELHTQGLIDRRPALIAVQAEAVSPLATAFHAAAEDLIPATPATPATLATPATPATPVRPTLAEGIAIRRPPRARQILRAVRESGGTFLTVTEEQIRTAQLDLAARGLYVESTGVACWAALRAAPLPAGHTAVVPLCGAGAKTGLAVP